MKLKLTSILAGAASLFAAQTAQAETLDCNGPEWMPTKFASTKFLGLRLSERHSFVVDFDRAAGTYRKPGAIWVAAVEVESCETPGTKQTVELDRFFLSEAITTDTEANERYARQYGAETIKEAREAMYEQFCTRGENEIVAEGKKAHPNYQFFGSKAYCPAAN